MHRIAPDGQPPLCGLTRETVPLAGRCCHWQAAPTRQITLHLADDDVAPWLGGSAAQVFAESSSAPPITVVDGRVVVALRDLSVPLVYGVPADGWDAALGWDTPALWDATTPGDETTGQAIIAALEALEQDAPALADALTDLARVLAPDGAQALPDGWADLLTSLTHSGRDRYGTDTAIRVQLDALEDALCILH